MDRTVVDAASNVRSEVDGVVDERGVPSDGLRHDQADAQSLADYLSRMVQLGDITHRTATLAWDAWNQFVQADPALPPPNACPGPDGQLLFTWDDQEHHVELEIFPEGPAEMFYRNRSSGALWEYDFTIGDPIAQSVKDKLRLVRPT